MGFRARVDVSRYTILFYEFEDVLAKRLKNGARKGKKDSKIHICTYYEPHCTSIIHQPKFVAIGCGCEQNQEMWKTINMQETRISQESSQV